MSSNPKKEDKSGTVIVLIFFLFIVISGILTVQRVKADDIPVDIEQLPVQVDDVAQYLTDVAWLNIGNPEPPPEGTSIFLANFVQMMHHHCVNGVFAQLVTVSKLNPDLLTTDKIIDKTANDLYWDCIDKVSSTITNYKEYIKREYGDGTDSF